MRLIKQLNSHNISSKFLVSLNTQVLQQKKKKNEEKNARVHYVN